MRIGLRSCSGGSARFVHTLGVIHGDGVGKEVVEETLRVLSHVHKEWNFLYCNAGFETFQKEGNSLPQSTIETLEQCEGALFGAVGSPSHKVDGYVSPIIQMRNKFGLFANLRPVVSAPVKAPGARANVDMFIVRENTECLYVKKEVLSDKGDVAVAQRVISRHASQRIAEVAFEIAEKRNKNGSPKVTVVHKSNVLSVTDGMFRESCLDVAKSHPSVKVEEQLVDSMVYKMIQAPEQYDVVVAPNLYGDILSDAGAALVGGLGLVPSMNSGDNFFIAEPVHGSAPDIAGKGIANPIACIRSGAMICLKLGLVEEGERIEKAVYRALKDGILTHDLGGTAKMSEMTNAIIERI